MSTVTMEPCRITVCGPSRTIEVAVPTNVPLADLLPTLIGYLGSELPDAGLEHSGWVLQRLGGPAFDEDLTVAALGIRDGEVLHLRPRAEQLPPVDFDDLIDGVATGIAERRDRWRPAMTRWLLLGLLLVVLATAWVLLFLSGPTTGTTIAAGVTAVVLVAGATAASRALDDRGGAACLGIAALGFAVLANGSIPTLVGGGTAHQLTAGAAGVVVAAPLLMMATGLGKASYTGTAVGGVLVALAGLLGVFTSWSPVEIAAVTVTVVLPLTTLVPVTAFRLARMQLEPLPTTPEELQLDLDPAPGAEVLERTAEADRMMTALYWGLGTVTGGALTILAVAPGWPVRLFTLTAILLLALQYRVMVSAWQRLAGIVPATLGAALLVASLCTGLGEIGRYLTFGAGLGLAGLCYLGSRLLPGRRLVPYWGRAADLAQSLTAIALLPLALWVLDVYRIALGWFGS